MDEDERLEYEAVAREHGISYMLDVMGMVGIGNDVNDLHKRITVLESQLERLTERCATWYDEAIVQRISAEKAEVRVREFEDLSCSNCSERWSVSSGGYTCLLDDNCAEDFYCSFWTLVKCRYRGQIGQ